MGMNIGMILQESFPPDIRVEKEARALIRAGYRIFLLSLSISGRPREEVIEGITVYRIPLREGTLRHKVMELIFCINFMHPVWKREIAAFVDRYHINVLHVHDLPGVKTALAVAQRKGIPVVADLHENYPAALQVWDDYSGLKGYLTKEVLFNYRRWSQYEGDHLRETDHIITVVDEAKDRLVRQHGLNPSKITVVSNTEELDFFHGGVLDEEIIGRYQGHFILSYIGGFGPHRGIDCAIRAMGHIGKNIPNVKLLLVGSDNPNAETEMRNLAKAVGAGPWIEFIGWQPFGKVFTFISVSDICLIPYNFNEQTDNSLPHKMFQYMILGKPLLVSSCRSLKRIVEETGSGLVFEAGNADDLASKAMTLYHNKQLRLDLGKNGQKATLNGPWNWEETAKDLIELYKDISWK